MPKRNGLNVCVIGAGVIGLTTALKLQEQLGNNINCQIVADKFTIDTTSHVAAGIFRPANNLLVSTTEITKKCINDSYQYYLDLLNKDCGVFETSGYVFSSRDPDFVKNQYLEDLLPVYRQATEEELVTICPGNWKYGSYFTTFIIECKHYLPWAMRRFEENGGKIIKSKIENVSDLVEEFGKFDLIMNCSGLGSKKLFGDSNVVPIRGQIFKVRVPWLDKFYYDESDTYIIPSSGGMATLGGTRNYDCWETEVCRYDADSIWERCTNLVPRLNNDAYIVGQYVGLRPHRDSGVRIEKEIVKGLKVVHNYGHGGSGVTSAPGTANHAVNLAIQFLKSNTSKL